MKRRLRITALGFKKGWVGVYNRTTTDRNITLTKPDLGFIAFEESYNLVALRQSFRLKDVWSGEIITITDKHTFRIAAEGAAFFSFQMQ
jgi:alpha-galactosidase